MRAEAPRNEGRYELSAVMEQLRLPMRDLAAALTALLEGIESLAESSADIEKLCEQLCSAAERLSHLASDETWDGLRWIDVNPRSIRLHLTPLDVADSLGAMINNGAQAWVFTSATLAVGDDFGHFTSRVGLLNATGLRFPSPYALDRNGLIWLPPDLPQPSDPAHTDTVLERVVDRCGDVG